jgi:O-antigen ligase
VYISQFRVESPHNVYLGIAAGAGFPALAAYLLVVGGFAVSTLRAARRSTRPSVQWLQVTMVAAIAGHLVTDLFMTADLTTAWLAWLTMGMGLASVRFSSTSTRT